MCIKEYHFLPDSLMALLSVFPLLHTISRALYLSSTLTLPSQELPSMLLVSLPESSSATYINTSLFRYMWSHFCFIYYYRYPAYSSASVSPPASLLHKLLHSHFNHCHRHSLMRRDNTE